MGTLPGQIRVLIEQELYESAIYLCDFLIASKPEGINYYLFGDALFGGGQYMRAFQYYKRAVEELKTQRRTRSQQNSYTEIDGKIKMATCLFKLKQGKEAIRIIQHIPVKQLSIKILSLSAKTYLSLGKKTEAINMYQRMLVVNPMAMEASLTLTRLGVDSTNLNNLNSSASSNHDIRRGDCAWITTVLEAESALFKHKLQAASGPLAQLNTSFPACSHVLSARAKLQSLSGRPDEAREMLLRAHHQDRFDLTHISELALLLRRNGDAETLRGIVHATVSAMPEQPCSWVTQYHTHLYIHLNHTLIPF